jgi:hypothetical protein
MSTRVTACAFQRVPLPCMAILLANVLYEKLNVHKIFYA